MNLSARLFRGVTASALLAALLFVAAPAAAETVIRNVAGTGNSTAYSVGGLAHAFIQVEAAVGTSDATVLIQQRLGPSSSWQTVKTLTNPAAGDVAYEIDPVGEVRVSVTAHASGTIKATLAGYTVAGTEATW